jgi:hypothetical protein
MGIASKLRIKDAIKSEPISHIVRGASTKDTIKSILDPGELLLKQSPEGSGWYPGKSRADQKAEIEKKKKKRATGMKAGGSTTRKRRQQRNKRAPGMKGGGICRGGGAATRGMKFGKNG